MTPDEYLILFGEPVPPDVLESVGPPIRDDPPAIETFSVAPPSSAPPLKPPDPAPPIAPVTPTPHVDLDRLPERTSLLLRRRIVAPAALVGGLVIGMALSSDIEPTVEVVRPELQMTTSTAAIDIDSAGGIDVSSIGMDAVHIGELALAKTLLAEVEVVSQLVTSPGGWEPPTADAPCREAIDWIMVKLRTSLGFSQGETVVLDEILDSCDPDNVVGTVVAGSTPTAPTRTPEEPGS